MKKETIEAKISVNTLSKWMMGGGFVLIILSGYFNSTYASENILWLNVITKVGEGLGTTIFSAALVSVIVEISTIKGLVVEAFEKLLNGDFPANSFSDERLKDMNALIAATLTEVDKTEIDKTIYHYENKLLELVNGVYYENHNITYYITPDSANNCFHILAKLDLRINNRCHDNDNNIFKIGMKLFKEDSSMTLEQCREALSFKNFKVNGKSMSVDKDAKLEILAVEHQAESKYYDYKIVLEKQLGSAETSRIELQFEYNVPMYDICQSFKISVPCKNVQHKIFIKEDISTNEKWVIRANAYSTFYHKQDDENSNFKVDQNVDDALTIMFKDWALIGNGYCVFYQKSF